MKKLIIVVFMLLALVGCGSAPQGGNVVSGYDVSVSVGSGKLAQVDMQKEIEIMEHDGFAILGVEGNVITATVTDASLNKYIEEGMWIKIDGVNVHLKRMID